MIHKQKVIWEDIETASSTSFADFSFSRTGQIVSNFSENRNTQNKIYGIASLACGLN